MSLNYLLITLSFVFGVYFVYFLRRYDIHEKEPFHKMALVTLWGGIWSIVICTLLYEIFHFAGVENVRSSLGALFVIGPVEEVAKLIALFSSYFIFRKELNEPTDGLIYMSCVALGFSLIENYFYGTKTPDSSYLVLTRVLICTPAHILFSGFMGLAFYVLLKTKTGLGLLTFSVFYASALHGTWDLFAFSFSSLLIFLLILIISYSLMLDVLGYTTAKSPFRTTLTQFVETFENTIIEDGLECLSCGNKDRKKSYRLGNINIQKCDQCGCYLTTKNSLYYIFHNFGSTFKNLAKLYMASGGPKGNFCTLYKGNHVDDDKEIGYFHLNELNDALEEMNQSVIERMERKWWFPKSLTYSLNKDAQ